jgi:hypothetical protein
MSVVELAQASRFDVTRVLDRYGLSLELTTIEQPIAGSPRREREARLKGDRVRARPDTPLHSILHAAARYACMTPERRAGLDIGAGGGDAEESAACYLKILLADYIRFFGRGRMLQDMDTSGSSFSSGSAKTWFENEAAEERDWLCQHALIDERAQPTWKLREW